MALTQMELRHLEEIAPRLWKERPVLCKSRSENKPS
jgi:hypothetical protein